MMKKFTLILALFFGIIASSSAQFLENFDAGTTIPAGWSVINQGDANTWIVGVPSGGAHSGTNSARITYSTAAHDDYLITPQITPTAGVNDRLTFWVRNYSASFIEHYQVLVSTTDASASSNFSEILIDDTAAPQAWTKMSLDLTPYNGQPIYVAFRALSADMWYLFIDDVENDSAPVGPPNCDAVLTTPADGATGASISGNISWSAASGDPTGYNLTVGTSPGGSDILATTDVGNVTTYALGTLTESTTYYVSIVPYSANGDASGCTEYSFTTRDPIAGDFCSGAIDLTLETSPLSGSTVEASNDNTPTCGGTSASPDVYYSILVPNGSTLTIQQTTNSYDSVVSMFYGDCTNQTAIKCYDDPDTQVNVWANTTGSDQTVYFVVDGYGTNGSSGTFTLAWSVVACSNSVATYTVVSNCDIAEEFFIDVEVTDLGTATSLTVSDDQGSATQTVFTAGIVQFGPYPNTTPVVITIANDQDSNCTITSSVLTQAVCPPNCENATVIAACDEDVVAAIPAGSGSWNVNTCGYSTPGIEQVYSFTPAIDGVYSLEVINATGGYVDYYYKEASGSCDATGWTCIDDNFGAGTDPIGILTAGTEYLILLDSEGTTARTHTFRITCPPTCTDATVSYAIVSNCDVAPEFFVDVNITDLGTATSITVSDDQGSATQNVTTTGVVQFGPYANGTPVIFTVANDQDASCVLTSSTQSQAVCPPNCGEATVIECDSEIVADFIAGPGSWNVNTCGFSTPGVENIYSFTAPTDGTYSLEVTAATGGYVDYYYKEASGSCDATGWTCIDDNSATGTDPIGTLTAGTEYLILLDSEGTTARNHTFKVVCPVLATDTFDNANFTYKPNPVVDVLNLEYNKAITNVSVYNLVGQQVIAKTVNANMSQIDMSSLPSGTYMVKVTSNNEVKTIKVVKE